MTPKLEDGKFHTEFDTSNAFISSDSSSLCWPTARSWVGQRGQQPIPTVPLLHSCCWKTALLGVSTHCTGIIRVHKETQLYWVRLYICQLCLAAALQDLLFPALHPEILKLELPGLKLAQLVFSHPSCGPNPIRSCLGQKASIHFTWHCLFRMAVALQGLKQRCLSWHRASLNRMQKELDFYMQSWGSRTALWSYPLPYPIRASNVCQGCREVIQPSLCIWMQPLQQQWTSQARGQSNVGPENFEFMLLMSLQSRCLSFYMTL